jgi:hypothetical protein
VVEEYLVEINKYNKELFKKLNPNPDGHKKVLSRAAGSHI